MLDPCNSFLDSAIESDVGDNVGEEVMQEDISVDDLIDDEELDVTGTLFATLFTEVSNPEPESTCTLTDIMSSSSDNESNDIANYLSRTQENLVKEVTEPQEKVQKRKTRSLCKSKETVNSTSNVTNHSFYSRPPLMSSSTINTKSPRVELQKLDLKSSASKTDKCMTKNAVIARENREKRKKYVQQLESNYEQMKIENFDLQSKLAKKSRQCDSLQKEIQYLRNVLANHSGISALLKNIHTTQGLSFSSSIESSSDTKNISNKKRQLDENDNYDNKGKGIYVRATGSHKKCKQDREQPDAEDYSPPLTPDSSPGEVAGGVCLHVNENKVSLELCSKCAENASNAWNKAVMLDVAVHVNENTVKEGKSSDSTV